MSTDLWLKLTNHSVVMRVIYDNTSNETLAKIDEYVRKIESFGARAEKMATPGGIECPLASQTQR